MTKHFLSICAIVRNEASYIAEWMEFHRLQGVEHFYIYHNGNSGEGSADLATSEVVAAQRNKHNDITFLWWPGKKQQVACYNDCLANYGKHNEWIAFTDIDEFLWCPTNYPYADGGPGASGPPLTLPEILKQGFTKKGIAGLAIPWTLFGSNGEKEKRDGLVIERFTTRASVSNKHVKSVVRPSFIQSAGRDPHCFYLKDNKNTFIINERGEHMPREYALHGGGTSDIIRINHYHTKSFGEYLDRRRNPDANSGRAATPDWVVEKFNAHDCNEVRDFTVRDWYAQKIKEALCR